jgi:hypothetical protein
MIPQNPPKNSRLELYQEKLHNMPEPGGNGCHPALQSVANHGRMAGLNKEQIITDLQTRTSGGTRTVTEREISAAVDQAFTDLEPCDTLPTDYTPAPAPPPKPEPSLDLQNLQPVTEDAIQGASPLQPDPNPQQQAKQFLDAVFRSSEWVYIGDRETTATPGENLRKRSEWMQQDQIQGALYGSNPYTGEAAPTQNGKQSYRAQAAVSEFNYLVIEFDSIDSAEQLRRINWLIRHAPVCAVYFSGSKSWHCLIYLGAESAEHYAAIVNKLRPYLVALGADRACLHPGRLSRLPGATRPDTGKVQRLIYLNPEPRGSWENLLGVLQRLDDNHDHQDKLPPDARAYLPAPMRTIIDMLMQNTHATPDALTLGLFSLMIPLLQGSRVHTSKADPNGETVRIYVLIIGPSGVGKTIVISRAEPALLGDLQQALEEKEQEKTLQRQHLEIELQNIGRGKEDRERRKQITRELLELEPSHATMWLESATREGLYRVLETGSAVMILLDEFGALLNRAERSEKDRDMVDSLTQIADRGAFRPRALKSEAPPRTVRDVSISICATTTPEDLPQHNTMHLLRGGHVARYMPCYITEARPLPERDYLTAAETRSLRTWRDSVLAAVSRHNHSFYLSAEARAVLGEYRRNVSDRYVQAANSGDADSGAIVRLIRQAKSISLLLHLGDPANHNQQDEISAATMQQACNLSDYYHRRHHARLLHFAQHGEERAQQHTLGQRIISHLEQNGGRGAARDIYRALHIRADVCRCALEGLEQSGHVWTDGKQYVLA